MEIFSSAFFVSSIFLNYRIYHIYENRKSDYLNWMKLSAFSDLPKITPLKSIYTGIFSGTQFKIKIIHIICLLTFKWLLLLKKALLKISVYVLYILNSYWYSITLKKRSEVLRLSFHSPTE